jgi:hypothetical protein
MIESSFAATSLLFILSCVNSAEQAAPISIIEIKHP